ncbi:glycosyltransferase [Bacillus sp. ISL-4]|uniref:glycosyltransferase n=1 Tax=Bacillus sp. ISL-4 TaxID=2819125 RepID=UPI001BEC8BD6|nr:glycosyltransferase [Bacillus sp. ISL-4]MBT2667487.1 glycosyltransferase [Bacillus sp. ISL-4]MBT2672974.1 glycosyltransferase [Streptomyces sp. ISL-14]
MIKKNKIMYLITGLDTGGAEMQVYHLARKLIDNGIYEPVVVSMRDLGNVGNLMVESGIKTIPLNMNLGLSNLNFYKKISSIIKKEKICVIHAHMFHAILLGRMLKILHPKVKIISTIHSVDVGGKLREKLLRTTEWMSEINTVISELSKKSLKNNNVISNKTITIPNGIETSLFQYKESERLIKRNDLGLNDEFIWLSVGRFHKVKNHEGLLLAFNQLIKQGIKTKLLLAGEGPLLASIKELVNKLELNEHVLFLGLQNDICSIMSAADGFVMSSLWEGLPMVLLEAASTELPIVATDVGGNREIIKHKETGLLVNDNTHEELAKMMLEMMSYSEETRNGLKLKAKNWVENNYSLDNIVNKWENIYDQYLQHDQGKSRY